MPVPAARTRRRHLPPRRHGLLTAGGSFLFALGTLGLVAWRRRERSHRLTQRRTEDALRAGEAQFRAVFHNAAIGIGLFDVSGRAIRVNAALCRMLRATEADLLGQAFADITHPGDIAQELLLYRQLAEGRSEGYQLEKRFLTRDGRTRWGSVTVSLVRDGVGRPSYAISLVEDVHERRQLQEQFLQAQKMEGIGRLAGGVAHDFNNLLTAIMGYAEMLRADLEPGHPTVPFVDEISKAGARAATLTSQLLAFARRQVIEPRVLDLNAVVSDAERMLRRLVGEDVEIVTSLDPGLGAIAADQGQLQQVLVNLAVNARDAMPRGGRLVIETANIEIDEHYARTHVAVRPGSFVMLAVSDTGSGMPREVREHLFEPFFTTKEQGRGTGLGLATCHGIVTQSGGHIGVYSEPGLGTTFRVYLPRIEARAPAPVPHAPAPPLRGGTETIVVAEDEPAVRQLAALSLRSHGYHVLDAASGPEALDIAREHAGQVRLLVTDVVMPAMGGRELAERFTDVCPRARVLFVSGHAESAMAHHGVLDPGVAFLPKPFTPERLARRVRDVLDAAV